MDIKRFGPKVEARRGKHGGNKAAQTFRICRGCSKEFGPIRTLKQTFCSRLCFASWHKPKFKIVRKKTKEATAAHWYIHYAIKTGKIKRPKNCGRCLKPSLIIEAAHHDYSKPKEVTWLCRSCHRYWDCNFPKGGTEIKQLVAISS